MKPVLRPLPDYRDVSPTLTESTTIRTDLKTIGVVLVAFAAGIAGWLTMRGDIAAHSTTLQVMQASMKTDHDLLTELHAGQKQQRDLLEILVYGRKVSNNGSRGGTVLNSPEP